MAASTGAEISFYRPKPLLVFRRFIVKSKEGRFYFSTLWGDYELQRREGFLEARVSASLHVPASIGLWGIRRRGPIFSERRRNTEGRREWVSCRGFPCRFNPAL